MTTRFPRLFATLTGRALPLTERERLSAQLQQARAKHQASKPILDRLRIVTNDELAAFVARAERVRVGA